MDPAKRTEQGGDWFELPQVGGVLGPYRLLRRLGAGTTGTVFEVEHQRIGRRAAMKVLSPMVPVPNVMDRFVVEAQAVNVIKDPHVVEVTDILESHDGRPLALVMELLEGQSLADLIAGEDKLPVDRALRILGHLCQGLAAVHAAGFVHRDLKPENVFVVERDGNPDFVKLLDFGLVKPVGEGGARTGCGTVEGTFLGSPAYASPEQAAGKSVDLRSDIYSLGVLAYELLTGELLFMADGFREVLMKHMTAPPPHLPAEVVATDLGRSLDDLLQTCLAKDPAQRLFSAGELAEMFRGMANGQRDLEALRPRAPGRPSARRRIAVAASALGLGLAALGLVVRRPPAHGPVPSSAQAAIPAPPPSRPQAQGQPAEPAARAIEPIADGAQEQPKGAARSRRQARNVRLLVEATTLDPFQ
jgi:serine/threonine-protein kinase